MHIDGRWMSYLYLSCKFTSAVYSDLCANEVTSLYKPIGCLDIIKARAENKVREYSSQLIGLQGELCVLICENNDSRSSVTDLFTII